MNQRGERPETGCKRVNLFVFVVSILCAGLVYSIADARGYGFLATSLPVLHKMLSYSGLAAALLLLTAPIAAMNVGSRRRQRKVVVRVSGKWIPMAEPTEDSTTQSTDPTIQKGSQFAARKPGKSFLVAWASVLVLFLVKLALRVFFF